MTKQHQTVNTTHNKNEPKNQTICTANPAKRERPKLDRSEPSITKIIGIQRMTQRIKLNIAEKILPLKRKANHGKIQLTYKSQLTPLILLLPLAQIPPTPFLVISD